LSDQWGKWIAGGEDGSFTLSFEFQVFNSCAPYLPLLGLSFFLYCLPSGLFERWLVSHFLVGSTLNLASSWRSWAFWPSRFSRIDPRSPVHPMTQKCRRTMVDFHATKHISSHQSGKMKRNNVNNLNIQRIANAATMVIV